jgi:hypothetical protein
MILNRPDFMARAKLTIRNSIFVLGLLITQMVNPPSAYATESPPPAGLATQPADLLWKTECVDCQKRISAMRDRSLRLDAADHPHLVYGEDHLYYAWFDGIAWHFETADTSPSVGSNASLALDGRGHPHIAYMDTANSLVKYATKQGDAWEIQTIGTGRYPVLTLDNSGLPYIGYGNSGQVILTRWTGTAWEPQIVPNTYGGYVRDVSLALDHDNLPHITYVLDRDAQVDLLQYARWDGRTWDIQTIDNDFYGFFEPSLALNQSDQPYVVYSMDGLKYAYRRGDLWETEIVDNGGYGSIAIDRSGQPLISYTSNNRLKYAQREGDAWKIQIADPLPGGGSAASSLALSSDGTPHIAFTAYGTYPATAVQYTQRQAGTWQTQLIDREGDVGLCASMALDGAQSPHVSYYDAVNDDLRYAHRTNGTWQIETVDSSGDIGLYNSLRLDAIGRPHISYFDSTHANLKYAVRNGSRWEVSTVDSAGHVGYYTSLALDSLGRPYIIYYDRLRLKLKSAHWDGGAWEIQIIADVVNLWGFPSVALDQADQPHVCYSGRYMHWRDGAWQTEVYDSGGLGSCSLALDRSGQPHISYYTYYDLRYARWDGSAWTKRILTSARGNDFAATSIALDHSDRPHISSYSGGYLLYSYQKDGVWQLLSMTLDRSLTTA